VSGGTASTARLIVAGTTTRERARTGRAWLGRGLRRARQAWMDVTWLAFAGANLAAMRLLPQWQTVPFLAI
jgi:hypothetical protein